jgi:hypothetical protein
MIFSKKRINNIIKSKYKSNTRKKLKKKKYKKHNSFRRRKKNLRTGSIKIKKKRIAKKKRKAFIRRWGGKKRYYSNIDHLNHLENFFEFKINKQIGGANDITYSFEEIKKYLPIDFLLQNNNLNVKLYKDDDIVAGIATEAASIDANKTYNKNTKRQNDNKKIKELPSSNCKPHLLTVGDKMAFWINPTGQDCDSNTIQDYLKEKYRDFKKTDGTLIKILNT